MSIPHEKSTRLVAACARSFKVEVEKPDVYRWSAALTMAKALDTLVDDDHVYDTGTYAELLLEGETIPHITDKEASFVRATYNTLNERTKEQWQRSASQLGAFALKRLEAKTVHEYIDVAVEESLFMSEVLKVETAPRNNDYRHRLSFNTWMTQMGRTAYLCDTLSDFIKDYNERNVRIKPTARSAAIIGHHALSELVAFARITPVPVYIALAHRSATKTIEKVQRPNFWSKQFIVNKPYSTSSVERSSQDL